MTHEEKALSYFKDKFHCSQSVLAAYADELGLTEEQALKIAYCFNAGMKKFLCAILFLTMVISLSACGGKGVSTLVKHYGQEKVDEMEIECTDETQLKVANDLIAEAKDIMSYCGSGDGTNKEDCGALERYYFFDDKAVRADVSIELVTTKQENGKGYIWVKYSADYYDKDDTLISGNGEAYSRWDIEQLDGKWTVTLIDEIP